MLRLNMDIFQKILANGNKRIFIILATIYSILTSVIGFLIYINPNGRFVCPDNLTVITMFLIMFLLVLIFGTFLVSLILAIGKRKREKYLNIFAGNTILVIVLFLILQVVVLIIM